jgi:hypothetical protein
MVGTTAATATWLCELYRFVGSARQLTVPNGSPSGSHFLRNVNFQARLAPVVPH